MRVSTKQFLDGLSGRMGQNQARLSRLQVRAASGIRIQEASEDPSGTTRALSLQTALNEMEQFGRNAEVARQKLGATDAVLGQMTETLRAARGIALQAANRPLTEVERSAFAIQLGELSTSLVTSLNSRDVNGYLFAGARTDTRPFEAAAEGPSGVRYEGDSTERSVQVGPAAHVTLNVPGDRLFNEPKTDILAALRTLRAQLESGGEVDAQAALRVTEAAEQQVLGTRAEVGSRLAALEAQTQQLEVAKENAQSTISSIMDADMAQTILELKTAETVYQASIATTARISQQSLMDYLE